MRISFYKMTLFVLSITTLYSSQEELTRGLVEKEKPHMRQNSDKNFIVGKKEFDDIFKPLYLDKACSEHLAVGYIKSTKKEFNDDGTRFVEYGTGTIVINKFDTVKVLTAKHVIKDNSFLEFFAGSVRTRNNLVVSIAKYGCPKKILFHNQYDLALITFRLILSYIPEDELREVYIDIDRNVIKHKKRIKIYHYPLGVSDLRINKGIILKNEDNHNASMLSGSSGAPIVIKDSSGEIKLIGVNIESRQKKTSSPSSPRISVENVGIRNVIEKFALKNRLIRISDVDFHMSSLTEIEVPK